jgi:hypothetical protein
MPAVGRVAWWWPDSFREACDGHHLGRRPRQVQRVLCRFEPHTRDAHFRTVPTTPDNLRRELARHPGAAG